MTGMIVDPVGTCGTLSHAWASEQRLSSPVTGASTGEASQKQTASSTAANTNALSREHSSWRIRRFGQRLGQTAATIATIAAVILASPANAVQSTGTAKDVRSARQSQVGLHFIAEIDKGYEPSLASQSFSSSLEALVGTSTDLGRELSYWTDIHGSNLAVLGITPSPIEEHMETADIRPPKYPPSLMNEYKMLVNKKGTDRLNVKEQRRLSQIIAGINAIDKADPETQRSLKSVKEARKGLADIRRELEDLLATASSPTDA